MVKLYSRPGCVQCAATEKMLNKLGIAYTKVHVNDMIAEELREEGFTALPVVHTPVDMWSGFRPDKLATLAA